jgi:NAD-dependent deacetylase
MAGDSNQYLQEIRCAADIIRGSQFAIALSGAGISTPSGIPDFRSPNSGLWERYDPFEVASLDAFRYRPEKFYNWMRPLARNIKLASPNPAHFALARLEKSGYLKTIITQNIDGLHQRAGSIKVLEVHGSLQTLTCVGCYRQQEAAEFAEAYIERGEIPICPLCNGMLKPDVVLFGEQLPSRTWLQAKECINQCDLMLVVGSSLEVLPVAGLPMRAVDNGAHLIIINQSETYIDLRADIILSEDVAITLPRIIQEVLGD